MYDILDLRLVVVETVINQNPKGLTSICCRIHRRQAICQHPTVTASITIGSAAQIGHSLPCSDSICVKTSLPYLLTISSSWGPESLNRASKSSRDTSSAKSSWVELISGSDDWIAEFY